MLQYGDGIQLDRTRLTGSGVPGDPYTMVKTNIPGKITLLDSRVDSNARAGVSFFGSGGLVDRSVISNNVLPIALIEGADPTIGNNNRFVGNKDDRIAHDSTLKPAPLPLLPPPSPP